MSRVIHDECIKNLFYAQEAMKEWIPMTEYEVIFEASEKSSVAEDVEKNEKTTSKAVGFLKKAIDAVITLLKKIYESVRDFVERCFMSGEERDAFNDFKEAMALDPTLKNKKVTVHDFRKIESTYDNLLKEIDQAIRDVKENENHPIENLLKKVTDFTKGAVGGVSAVIAAETALRMAESNVQSAKLLKKALKEDESIMKALSESLGEKDALRVQKRIDSAAKRTLLYRLRAKVLGHKYESLSDCVRSVIKTLTHEGYRDLASLKDQKKVLKDQKKEKKITDEEYKQKMSDIKKEIKDVKKEKLTLKDSIDTARLDRQILNNPHAGGIAKTIRDSAVAAARDNATDKAKTWVQDHITDRKHKKRDAEARENKSLAEFVFGKPSKK